jgi:hypothetical protein
VILRKIAQYSKELVFTISLMEIKNPTSQDESGVLFQINHFDPPSEVKGAVLIVFSIQGSFMTVNR